MTKAELIKKNAALHAQLAEREQQRLDNIQLTKELLEARNELAKLKAAKAKVAPKASPELAAVADLARREALAQ